MKKGKERRSRDRKGREHQGKNPETLPLTLLYMRISIGEAHNLPDIFHHVQNKKLKPPDFCSPLI